jgi:hypothetical protein
MGGRTDIGLSTLAPFHGLKTSNAVKINSQSDPYRMVGSMTANSA